MKFIDLVFAYKRVNAWSRVVIAILWAIFEKTCLNIVPLYLAAVVIVNIHTNLVENAFSHIPQTCGFAVLCCVARWFFRAC